MGEQLGALDRLETVCRKVRACAGDLALAVDRGGDEALGSLADRVIADVIRISPADARRRIRDAAQMAPRTTLTGLTLQPVFPATAKAWHAGLMDQAHLCTIRKFFRDLPDDIHPDEVATAEEFLAEQAAVLRPDQLEAVADKLAVTINPDGTFSDDYRAAQRGFTWRRQRRDGMSEGAVVASPELRSMLDAWFAKFAAPGMCNPADQSPCVTGEPTPERLNDFGWTTRKRQDGRTEWLPPPHLPIPPGTNDFHHPERFLDP